MKFVFLLILYAINKGINTLKNGRAKLLKLSKDAKITENIKGPRFHFYLLYNKNN